PLTTPGEAGAGEGRSRCLRWSSGSPPRAEWRVVARHGDAEPLAERGDVGPVRRVDLVAGVTSHQPLGRDAVHRAVLDRPLAAQRAGGILIPVLRRTVGPASVLVERNHVEVDLAPGVVAQNEIPGPRVGTRHRLIPATV